MVGGRARVRSPREQSGDPEAWPDPASGDSGEPGVEAVRQIAVLLTAALAENGWSLRETSARSGVNRQAIADLLAGNSWPDVATVARLSAAVQASLWPDGPRGDRTVGH